MFQQLTGKLVSFGDVPTNQLNDSVLSLAVFSTSVPSDSDHHSLLISSLIRPLAPTFS